METAIQVVWWIGLIGALPATLLIVKEVALVARVLRHILELAELTREAAQQLERNVAVIPELDDLEQPVAQLRQTVAEIGTAAASIKRKLSAARKSSKKLNF
jgi:hypothetical protein